MRRIEIIITFGRSYHLKQASLDSDRATEEDIEG
jgi:hypothetical protein